MLSYFIRTSLPWDSLFQSCQENEALLNVILSITEAIGLSQSDELVPFSSVEKYQSRDEEKSPVLRVCVSDLRGIRLRRDAFKLPNRTCLI